MTRPLLFGLLILLGCGGGSATASNPIVGDKEGRELTTQLLVLSQTVANFYKAKEPVVNEEAPDKQTVLGAGIAPLIIVGAGEPTVEPPLPSLPPLPPNCSYLNLWSYYYRWTTAGQPIDLDGPFTPNIAADRPLTQYETYLFAPPESISFATADCGLSWDNPCIVPVGTVTEGFGKVAIGKMIRNTLSVDDVYSCSDEDIGYSTNMMIFLDPKVNAESGIVQYQSSLAVYLFEANTKKDCMYNSNIDSYPITGGTGLLLSASGSVSNGKQVHVEREDGFFDMYIEYLYTVCTPHSAPPVPKSPKKGKGQRM